MNNKTLKGLECVNGREWESEKMRRCECKNVRKGEQCGRASLHLIFSFLLLVIFLLSSELLSAQDWNVPANKTKALSPFKFTDETRKAGEVLYMDKCQACHGDPGKGNVLMTVPAPPDLATKKMQRNTDGEMFYKISEGHTVMLSFRNILSATEIWNLVSYVRGFNDNYKQQVAPKEEGATGKTKISGEKSKKKKRCSVKEN